MAESLELTSAELSRLRSGIRIMALSALRDLEAAEEVAQESLARVVLAIREGRPRDPHSLGAFARGIARHVIVDTLRARQRETTLGLEHERPAEGDPLATLLSAEQAARIRAALEQLSSGDRELLRLSFFEGMTPQEVAERLGEPSTRIRKRKERALARLREAFLQTGGHTGDSIPTQSAEARSALTGPRTIE